MLQTFDNNWLFIVGQIKLIKEYCHSVKLYPHAPYAEYEENDSLTLALAQRDRLN